METAKTYYWKVFEKINQYSKESVESTIPFTLDLDLSFIKHSLPNEAALFDSFKSNFTSFTISKEAKSHIDDLLHSNNILNRNKEFYLISAVFQYNYISEIEDLYHFTNKGWQKDLETASSQKEKFLDILRLKVNNEKSGINSISFKTDKAQTINNFFVVDDILVALIDYYSLTPDNFESKKAELIGNYSRNKIGKTDIRLKFHLMTGLNNFICDLIKLSTASNRSLRFVGSFFLISQIPLQIKNPEIPKASTITVLMHAEDIKYLHTFLHRNDSF
ncbi:MAG: hypothetical protein V4572_00275 [Bacteroidota bacterium]